MNLTDYKVRGIVYPHGEYRLGTPAEIIDENGFYRIDGTHIFDKHKILSIEKDGEKIEFKMKDKDVVLIL